MSGLEPGWNARQVVLFAGQHDTHIETGEDYDTGTLADLFAMEPGRAGKRAALAFIPSTYADFDARCHSAQREFGKFVALTGDIDHGDYALDVVKAAVLAFVGGAAWLIYSSSHAMPGDMRWRVVIPLHVPARFEAWHDAQCAFFDFMESRGIGMDRALARPGQPVYAPNVPAVHARTGSALRGPEGAPLHYQRAASGLDVLGLGLDVGPVAAGMEAIRCKRIADEAERERISAEAELRRTVQLSGDRTSLIDDFNASHSVSSMLEMCGYEQSPRCSDDWRSPHQSSPTFATRVIGSKWVSLSGSDAAAGVGATCDAGRWGDAFDLFVHFKFGGDRRGALLQLRAEQHSVRPSAVLNLMGADHG